MSGVWLSPLVNGFLDALLLLSSEPTTTTSADNNNNNNNNNNDYTYYVALNNNDYNYAYYGALFLRRVNFVLLCLLAKVSSTNNATILNDS